MQKEKNQPYKHKEKELEKAIDIKIERMNNLSKRVKKIIETMNESQVNVRVSEVIERLENRVLNDVDGKREFAFLLFCLLDDLEKGFVKASVVPVTKELLKTLGEIPDKPSEENIEGMYR